MTTQAAARRRCPRGAHPKTSDSSAQPRKLPEYLEAHEVEAVIRATDNPRAKLLMLEQWRAGLRIAEALALGVADLSLDADAQGARRQRQQVEDRTDAPRAAGGVPIGPVILQHQPGKARRYPPVDGVALGQGGCQEG